MADDDARSVSVFSFVHNNALIPALKFPDAR